MKYQIGDRVLIREDLKQGIRYDNEGRMSGHGGYGANSNMVEFAGMIATIVGIEYSRPELCGYHIDLCPVWYWADEMLEPFEEFKNVDVCELEYLL